MLINVWMGSAFVYVLILLNVSFPPFRGALVGSLPRVPPSPAVLGHWLSQEVAGLHPSMWQGRPERGPSRRWPLPKQSCKSLRARAGLHLTLQRKGSKSRPLAAGVGARAAPQGGSRGGSPPWQGLGVPVMGEGILPEEQLVC